MKRFFFDTAGGGGDDVVDAVGMMLSTEADARAEAMRLLPVAGIELPMSDGEYRTWSVTIRDDEGIAVFRFIMAIIGDRINPDGPRTLRPT